MSDITLDQVFEAVKESHRATTEYFGKLDARMDGFERRMDGFDTRMDRVERRLTNLAIRVDDGFNRVVERLDKLETRRRR